MLGLSGQAGPLPLGSILGTRVLRTEDPAILRRGGIYTDDLMDESLNGAHHAT
jgi:carbon-monoxide dehydrogenase large subunit